MNSSSKMTEFVINSATIRKQWELQDLLKACKKRGLKRVSIWADDTDKLGLVETTKILTDYDVRVFGFNRAGPLIGSNNEKNKEMFDAARKRVDQAFELNADHILIFSGGLPKNNYDLVNVRAQVEEAIGLLYEYAFPSGVKLALEPLHPMLTGDRTVIASLSHANKICDGLGERIGLVVDVYHVWWDEMLFTEIVRAGSTNRLLGFHVSDWLIPTCDMVSDRGMMGDGIIDLSRIWKHVKKAGYDGPVEVEIFSKKWWAEDPDFLFDIAIARCNDIFS